MDYTTIYKLLREYYYEQCCKYILTNGIDDIEDSYAIVNDIMTLSLSPELVLHKYHINKDILHSFIRDLNDPHFLNLHEICERLLLQALTKVLI